MVEIENGSYSWAPTVGMLIIDLVGDTSQHRSPNTWAHLSTAKARNVSISRRLVITFTVHRDEQNRRALYFVRVLQAEIDLPIQSRKMPLQIMSVINDHDGWSSQKEVGRHDQLLFPRYTVHLLGLCHNNLCPEYNILVHHRSF